MTTPAPSAAPACALRFWSDGRRIFAEIPGNPPTIIAYNLSEGGLSKALKLVTTKATDFAGTPEVGRPRHRKPLDTAHATAQRILKAKGVIR